MDIGLSGSVVELTRVFGVFGVPGSLPIPAIYFYCIFVLIAIFLLQTWLKNTTHKIRMCRYCTLKYHCLMPSIPVYINL